MLLIAAAGAWIYRRIRTAKWPVTDGTIEAVNVSAVRSLGRTFQTHENCTAEVSYSYSVAGQFYSGYWTLGFTDEQKAWDFVGPLKGRTVLVHYNPEHPEKSALAGFEG